MKKKSVVFYPKALILSAFLLLFTVVFGEISAGEKNTYSARMLGGQKDKKEYSEPSMEGVKKLLQGSSCKEIGVILESLQDHAEENKDLDFIIGMIAMELGCYDIAIMQFSELIKLVPDVVRVRLELARALFESGRDKEAHRQFRLARSGNLPPEVLTNIDRFLMEIRDRRTFSWNAGISVVPDTNVNAAPSLEEISIFGIPFKLSDDAKRTTGLGLMITSGAEWSPPVTDNTHFRIGGQIYHSNYSGSRFDDTYLSTYAGPRFHFRRSEFSPLISGFHRWYGGDPYNHGYGPRLEGAFYPTGRFRLGSSLERLKVNHEFSNELDGFRTNGILSGSYAINPLSGAHGFLGISRESAESRILSNKLYRIGGGYYREMHGGITALIQPEFLQAHYDESAPAFGKKRQDKYWRIRLEISSVRPIFLNLKPTVALMHSERRSNIDLYSYTRSQVQVGLRKVF